MKKPIYLFSPDIKWKTFKKIWDKFPHGSGPVGESFIKGKIFWQMVRDKHIYIYLDFTQKDDKVFFANKLPRREIMIIT
jgi:hypothetical protein